MTELPSLMVAILLAAWAGILLDRLWLWLLGPPRAWLERECRRLAHDPSFQARRKRILRLLGQRAWSAPVPPSRPAPQSFHMEPHHLMAYRSFHQDAELGPKKPVE